MQTIRLNIHDKIYDRVMKILRQFGRDEIEIIKEDASSFASNKTYLESELKEITDGEAKFVTFNEAEKRLENVIRKNEDNL